MTKFQKFYGNVKQKDAGPIREAVQELVAPQSFRNWANGIFEPDAGWWKKLNDIAVKFGYKRIYEV